MPADFVVVDYDIDSLISACNVFINYHILPYSGGYLEQPVWWREWLENVYIPGINRARYDALKPEQKKDWHFPPTKVEVPPGMEW